jgi:hypothetical protein
LNFWVPCRAKLKEASCQQPFKKLLLVAAAVTSVGALFRSNFSASNRSRSQQCFFEQLRFSHK